MKWGFLDDDSGYFYCIIYSPGERNSGLGGRANTWTLDRHDHAVYVRARYAWIQPAACGEGQRSEGQNHESR